MQFFVKLFHKICKGGTNKCSAAEKRQKDKNTTNTKTQKLRTQRLKSEIQKEKEEKYKKYKKHQDNKLSVRWMMMEKRSPPTFVSCSKAVQ